MLHSKALSSLTLKRRVDVFETLRKWGNQIRYYHDDDSCLEHAQFPVPINSCIRLRTSNIMSLSVRVEGRPLSREDQVYWAFFGTPC